MHCTPEWRKNAMIWMHYVWVGPLAKMTLHCWIIAISLSPQHNEILLLPRITQFIWKVHTVCISYYGGVALCVHSMQMLANELKHWTGMCFLCLPPPYLMSLSVVQPQKSWLSWISQRRRITGRSENLFGSNEEKKKTEGWIIFLMSSSVHSRRTVFFCITLAAVKHVCA